MPCSIFARAAIVSAMAFAVLAPHTASADRLKLWEIVHDQCVPAAAKGDKLPRPCLGVDPKAGDAVIKDRNGVAQLLDISLVRVTGIEDPRLLAAGAPNYFADAWRARGLMATYLKAIPPREGVAITINSEYSRSQDQLHLHVDCLAPEVAKALADYAPHFDSHWRPMTVALQGRRYWARRVDSADLAGVDPFRILAEEMPGAQSHMGQWSLAAVPIRFVAEPGFVLLADRAELTAGGHAEDLQDHDCALAR
jgi:CDP-diacylglycerol pyrophosphatase